MTWADGNADRISPIGSGRMREVGPDGGSDAAMRLSALSTSELVATRQVLRMSNKARSAVRRVTGRRNRMLALALWHRDKGICGRCGLPIFRGERYPSPFYLTIGHIRPLVAGGTNDLRNLRAEHLHCNVAAGDRDPAPIASVMLP